MRSAQPLLCGAGLGYEARTQVPGCGEEAVVCGRDSWSPLPTSPSSSLIFEDLFQGIRWVRQYRAQLKKATSQTHL